MQSDALCVRTFQAEHEITMAMCTRCSVRRNRPLSMNDMAVMRIAKRNVKAQRMIVVVPRGTMRIRTTYMVAVTPCRREEEEEGPWHDEKAEQRYDEGYHAAYDNDEEGWHGDRDEDYVSWYDDAGWHSHDW